MPVNIDVATGQIALMKLKQLLDRKLCQVLVNRLPAFGDATLTTDVQRKVIRGNLEVAAVHGITLCSDGNLHVKEKLEALTQEAVAVVGSVELAVDRGKQTGLLLLQRRDN